MIIWYLLGSESQSRKIFKIFLVGQGKVLIGHKEIIGKVLHVGPERPFLSNSCAVANIIKTGHVTD